LRLLTGGSGAAGASRLLFAAALALALAGCGRGSSSEDAAPAAAVSPAVEASPEVERLRPTWGSAEEAAEVFLEALAADDVERMRSTALSGEEFADVVWPELPSSRPNHNVPLDYAWRDLNQKSTNSLGRISRRYGGRRHRLERVEFLSETTDYITFAVHRDARLVLVDEEGVTRRLRLFGSMIERGGRWKLFSFVNDE